MRRSTAVLFASLAVCLAVPSAHAVSYIGVGGGYAPHLATKGIRLAWDSDLEVTHSDSFDIGTGWAVLGQFGWELAPWVDAEGAMRYHRASRSDTSSMDVAVKSYELIGFEGGIRIHPRRYITNTAPYIRLGVGSYSTTLNHTDEHDDVGFEPGPGLFRWRGIHVRSLQ